MKVADPKKASYEANTLRLHTGALEAQLTGYFNEVHEAVANGDQETVEELRQLVPKILDDFAKSAEAQAADNPEWIINTMSAGWHVALGEFGKAHEYEVEAWDAAKAEAEVAKSEASRKRMAISASNIADELLRLGRADEAFPWAERSVDLWESNAVNHLVFALVLYRLGLKKQADLVIDRLRHVAQVDDPRDALAKCMAYERELHGMTDLPAVRCLLTDLDKAGHGSTGQQEVR